MRCYSNKFVHDIHFDKTRYQQFLREQGLSEHAIKHLNILFITDFTHSHFRGSPTFTDGGAFFQRDREYVAKMNEGALGLYRPYYPSRAYAAIFLRPKRYETPVYLNQIFLNETLLHETRHHIQYCLNLPCSKPVDDAPVDGNALNERNRPWEIDAERFAAEYVNQVSFFLPVSRPLTRSDLL